MISKSDYLKFKECSSYFWFWKNKREVLDLKEEDAYSDRLVVQGIKAESYARKLYPGGKLIQSKGIEAAAETFKYISEHTSTLYQATFAHDTFLAMSDVLVWNDLYNGWDLYEIKATSSKDKKKKVHLLDATFQRIIAERAGYNIVNIYLIELNKEYIKEGEIDVNQLFSVSEITTETKEYKDEVSADLLILKNLLLSEEPKECSCKYKGRSSHCPAFNYLYPYIPPYSIFDLTSIGRSPNRLRALIDNDIYELKDIPPGYDLTERHLNQWLVHINQEPIIDITSIKSALDQLDYPLYFLDYETLSSAVPVYDMTYPYQQVVFQYSLHILHVNGELEHKEFLHKSQDTPVFEVAKSLRADIGDHGSVIVWNKSFEGSCNRDLATVNPTLSEFLLGLNDRFFDLIEIFKKQYYLHDNFRGSYSIKKVLPVLCPDLTYDELDISNGGTATVKYEEAMFGPMSKEDQEEVFENLLQYCKLDTLAMVRIYQELELIIY